jgi:hypothetical protein
MLKSRLSGDQQDLSTGPDSLILCWMSLGLCLRLPCPPLRQADQMLTICLGEQDLLTKSHSTWWERPAYQESPLVSKACLPRVSLGEQGLLTKGIAYQEECLWVLLASRCISIWEAWPDGLNGRQAKLKPDPTLLKHQPSTLKQRTHPLGGFTIRVIASCAP